MMNNSIELEKIVQVPKGWIDLPSFESFEKSNPGLSNWTKLYCLYSHDVLRPWINKANQLFGDSNEGLVYEDLNDSHFERVKPDGTINLTCGFYISFIDKSSLGFIPISVPIKYLASTINVLPYLMQARERREDILLSDIVETDNQAKITETGILLPPGEQIMVYAVEEVSMPNDYIGQATTKSGIGRRGLDTVATAGTFNKGWKGLPLLECNNRNLSEPILLEVGVPIAQFYFIDASHSEGQYSGSFQDQTPHH